MGDISTIVYPLIAPERTSSGMLAGKFLLHEEDGCRPQGLLLHMWKNDTSFASTFAAAQTTIIPGAGSSYLFDTVRRRLQMQTGKPMALGTSSATHRRPPFRRGRRHHGDSMSESIGALAPDAGGSSRRSERGAH